MSTLFKLFAFFTFITLVSSTFSSVQFQKCDDPNASQKCDIKDVRISPCAEAATDEPCRIKKGKKASIQFDYKPEVALTELESHVFWVGPLGTLPWLGADTDGCHFTNCPIVANQINVFNNSLNIDKTYSARIYKIQWQLLNEDENFNCCFTTRIRLV